MPGGRCKATVSTRKPKPLKKQYKAGRPETPVNLQVVELLIKKGAKDVEICKALGCSDETWRKLQKKYPKLQAQVRDWREQANTAVEKGLFRRACGYKHRAVKIMQYEGQVIREAYTEHYPPDTNAAKFWLTNRKPEDWAEKASVDVGGKIELAWASEVQGEPGE